MPEELAMIVDVPFVYTASVVPPRCRNAREVTIRDRVAVKLRVPEGGKFPVAFRVVCGRDVPVAAGEDQVAAAMANPAEVHWDGKALYAAWKHHYDKEPSGRLGAEALQAAVDARKGTPLASAQDDRPDWLRREKPLQGLPVREEVEGHVVADDRRERVAAILERAGEVYFHDGRFFDRTSEPVWEVDSGRWPRIEAKFSSAYEIERSARNLFRCDRAEEALAAAGGPDEAEVRGAIEVLVPEAVRLRLDDYALVESANSTVEGMKDEVHAVTVEFFAAYAALRDATARAKANGRLVDEELSAAVSSMLDAMPETDRWEVENWRKKSLKEAYDRWRNDLLRDLDPAALDAPSAGGAPDLPRLPAR